MLIYMPWNSFWASSTKCKLAVQQLQLLLVIIKHRNIEEKRQLLDSYLMTFRVFISLDVAV